MANARKWLAALCVCAAASIQPALAGDGDGEKSPATKGDGKCEAAAKCEGGACEAPAAAKADDGCCEAGECAKCKEGSKVEGSCCAVKTAAGRLRALATALLEEGTVASKVVADAVPEAARAKVAAACESARATLAKVRTAAVAAKADFEAACAAAKAEDDDDDGEDDEAEGEDDDDDGDEEDDDDGQCDAEATFEHDMKALHAKALEAVDRVGAVVKESMAEDRWTAVAADVEKAQEAAKAAMAKAASALKAAAAKVAGEENSTYRCGCNGKEWTQVATAAKACPFCGSAMPDCGEKVEKTEKAEDKPVEKPAAEGSTAK